VPQSNPCYSTIPQCMGGLCLYALHDNKSCDDSNEWTIHDRVRIDAFCDCGHCYSIWCQLQCVGEMCSGKALCDVCTCSDANSIDCSFTGSRFSCVFTLLSFETCITTGLTEVPLLNSAIHVLYVTKNITYNHSFLSLKRSHASSFLHTETSRVTLLPHWNATAFLPRLSSCTTVCLSVDIEINANCGIDMGRRKLSRNVISLVIRPFYDLRSLAILSLSYNTLTFLEPYVFDDLLSLKAL
jgi:hypothetical protein